MSRDNQAGFSLLEVLVVLALLATMAGVTLISFRASGRDGQPQTEAQLLTNRLSLASDEALVTGEALSLRWDETGYGIDVRSGQSDDWVPHPSGLFGARHDLPEGVRMEIDTRVDRIAIRSDGAGDAIDVVFSDADGGWRVSYDGLSARAAPVVR